MKNVKRIALCLLVLFAFGGAEAQVKVKQSHAGVPGSWQLLGTVQARLVADHDVIVVAGPYDYFRALKFKVTGAALNMERMVVTYDDGLPEKVDIRYNIPQGGESRVIDLKGGRRKVRSIEFWYKTNGVLNGRANVTVFGMK